MAYQLLGKLYYEDHSVYAQTYQARLNSEDTVKLAIWRRASYKRDKNSL